jgi:hypothetical protein
LTGIPLSGVSYRLTPLRPSLQLRDTEARFCQDEGLFPHVFLDLPQASCENECTLGIFVPRSSTVLGIARVPALHRAAGTFDVLVETRVPCEMGRPPIRLRFASAVTYVDCAGDCDADGTTTIDELMLGVGQALGLQSLGECAAHDTDGDGAVAISELIQAVRAALQGCPG